MHEEINENQELINKCDSLISESKSKIASMENELSNIMDRRDVLKSELINLKFDISRL